MGFTYKDAVEKLNSLQSNASLLEKLRKAGPRMNERSLPEMIKYFERIGYSPRDFDKLNLIHVTGTKGKGSTSAITQSILHNYDPNIKTGLFTSPHLVAVRERIRINGEPISEELFAKYSQYVWERLEATKEEAIRAMDMSDGDKNELIRNKRAHPDKPIYFRYLTLVALHAFIQEKVDCAILEVGVGGEYDSTNVIENPIVCGITALGLDHVSVLGNTIDQIAWHKAGIIKPNKPAVCFEQLPEAMEVVERRAKEKNAPLTILYSKQISELNGVEIGLAGEHQKYNALTAIELSKLWLKSTRGIDLEESVPEEFKKGLRNVSWPGRGQKLKIQDTKYASESANATWFLDGAHTTESLQVCTKWFQEVVEKEGHCILIFNCTHGRDASRLLQVVSDIQPLVNFNDVIFTTNITFKEGYTTDNTNNNVSAEELTTVQKTLGDSWISQNSTFPKDSVHIVGSIEEAVELVVEKSKKSSKQLQVLTTGSLIMVGNTLTVLGFKPQ
ncbi:Mur ligase [Sporodiniella umbellata]|nr:Mur ligase [Sporodiniella umbellata]